MLPVFDYEAHIYPASQQSPQPLEKVWGTHYTVQLNDGSWLELPLKPLPGDQEAIALLMSNQCDFTVTDHLTTRMAEVAATFQPDCIAAVPTMGLEYAPQVAKKLGHSHYVAMGFSHKYWYEGSIYEKIVSVTSPDQEKHLYLDPHLINRVKGKRVVIVDDVINTGASILAAVRLLTRLGADVQASIVMLTEGHAWEHAMTDPLIDGHSVVKGIGHIPIFQRKDHGWVADPHTL